MHFKLSFVVLCVLSTQADKFDIKQFVVMMPRFQPRVPKKKPVMDAAQAMGRKVSVREPPAARESEDEESEESEEEEEPEPDIPIAGDEKGPADVSDNAQHFYKWEEALLLEVSFFHVIFTTVSECFIISRPLQRCNLNFTFAVNSAAQIEGAGAYLLRVLVLSCYCDGFTLVCGHYSPVPQFRTVGIISAKNYREAVLLMQDKLLEAMQAEADAKAADSKP